MSWQRSDRAFFAAGACHILAFEYLLRSDAGAFRPVGLRRPGASSFDHVYVSDGRVAFDYEGLTSEAELINETLRFERVVTPALTLERVGIYLDLDELCARHAHRPPADFAMDPRPRARRYIGALIVGTG